MCHTCNYYSNLYTRNTDTYIRVKDCSWIVFSLLYFFLYIPSISRATHNLVGTNGVTLKIIIHIHQFLTPFADRSLQSSLPCMPGSLGMYLQWALNRQTFPVLWPQLLLGVSACKTTWGQHLTFPSPAWGILRTSMTILRKKRTCEKRCLETNVWLPVYERGWRGWENSGRIQWNRCQGAVCAAHLMSQERRAATKPLRELGIYVSLQTGAWAGCWFILRNPMASGQMAEQREINLERSFMSPICFPHNNLARGWS